MKAASQWTLLSNVKLKKFCIIYQYFRTQNHSKDVLLLYLYKTGNFDITIEKNFFIFDLFDLHLYIVAVFFLHGEENDRPLLQISLRKAACSASKHI